MKKIFFIVWAVLVSLIPSSAYAQKMGVGNWYTHFAYGKVSGFIQREAIVYAVAEKALYGVDTRDNTMQKLDRVSGLSNIDISAAAYNSLYDVIIIGYQNGCIDLVSSYDVKTITDIHNKEIAAEKKINHIYTEGRYAYAATDFGLIVIDLKKEEIKESYLTVSGGTYQKVSSCLLLDDYLYIVVNNRIKYASAKATSLNDYSTWKTDTCFGEEPVTFLRPLWGKVAVWNGTDFYTGKIGQGWEKLQLTDTQCETMFVETSRDCLLVGRRESSSGAYRIEVWTDQTHCTFSHAYKELASMSTAMLDESGYIWVATGGRLYKINSASYSSIKSYGFSRPFFDNHSFLTYTGNLVVSTMENYNSAFVPQRRQFGFATVKKGNWKNYVWESTQIPSGLYSATYVLEDPLQENRFYVASILSGLAVVENNSVVMLYTDTNSPLERNNSNHADIRLTSLAFDASGDLWMLNTLADKSLHVLHRDGTWHSYDLRVSGYNSERISDLMVDYWQHKWVLFNHRDVAVFETDGASLKSLKVDMNYGNDLNTSKVYCMLEDDLGYVWFGTDRGVKMIDQHAQMFVSPRGNFTSVPVKTVKVPKDGYLMELLKDDQVMAIAKDGANRKWLGTADNGLYLVSPDGMEEIAHFTRENSPLLSNNIKALAVDDQTGEVFIACEGGLVSYRGTATRTGNFEKSAVRAYPNPVKPGYEGFINIVGLPNNAYVKITDIRGNLIYQARATGGQLSWNGYNMQGRKPSGGVLLVYVAGEDKAEKVACKIFYVP